LPLEKRYKFFVVLLLSIIFLSSVIADNGNNANETNSPEDLDVLKNNPGMLVERVLESYENSCVTGTRILMETGESYRYRYEFVMRNGSNKIVSLKMPYRVTWYRLNRNGYIIQNGSKYPLKNKLKDLEDVFLEELKSTEFDIDISEIQYSGIPAFYVYAEADEQTYRAIVLKKSMQFIRIERQTQKNLTVMIYDNLNSGEPSSFNNQIKWYEDIPLYSDTAGSTESTTSVESTTVVEESTQEDLDEKILSDFEPFLEPILSNYRLQNTDLVEFTDARAMFMTVEITEKEKSLAIVIVKYKNKPVRMDSKSIFGKVPEEYNMVQHTDENVEINVIGPFENEYLQEILQVISPQEPR